MSNSVNNSRYAQAINVNPMSLYTPDSIFSSNILSPIYSDMYVPSRSFENRTMDKYDRPKFMWSTNKKIALTGLAGFGALAILTKGKSIKGAGKLLLSAGDKICLGIQKVYAGFQNAKHSIAKYIIDNGMT